MKTVVDNISFGESRTIIGEGEIRKLFNLNQKDIIVTYDTDKGIQVCVTYTTGNTLHKKLIGYIKQKGD